MTSSDKPCKAIRRILLVASCLLMSACTKDSGTDFCKNHYRFHDSHRDTVAMLAIKLTDDGLLLSELTLPYSIYADAASATASATLIQTLQQPHNVYNLQTAHDCQATSAQLSLGADAVIARYESRCGSDNKLGQIDVALFDTVPELDEIDVLVTTPATGKRFVINRQCQKAIFRVD